jgi:hypothetical protein
MGRDRAALKSREGRGPAEGIAQLLIAVSVKLGPDAQRAFVGADPGAEFDALGGKEDRFKFAVVRDVGIRAPEAVITCSGGASFRSSSMVRMAEAPGGWACRGAPGCPWHW